MLKMIEAAASISWPINYPMSPDKGKVTQLSSLVNARKKYFFKTTAKLRLLDFTR